MSNQKDKLINSIKLYLQKKELFDDIHFYTIAEWKDRNEEYLNDSEFVITSEGGLNFILNFGDSWEFYDLVESFGYFLEMGNSWSYGFYFDEDIDQSNDTRKREYADLLRDERWRIKSKDVKEKAKYLCQDCGNNKLLETHHCYYRYGLEPWQYPLDSLLCLCSSCHKKRGNVEMILRARMANLTTAQLEIISELINGGMQYYPEDKIANLIKGMNLDTNLLKEKLKDFFKST